MNKTNPEILKIYLTKLKKSWSDLDNILNLLNNWEIIVGKDMAKECKPLKIEKKVLTIVANQLQWRQALIYNKHKLKESISKTGIDLKNIRIIQNYEDKFIERKLSDNNSNWDNHPSRIKDKGLINCSICDRPTPIGEIERWGKCTFCWRETN